jgi:hypothetical protein
MYQFNVQLVRYLVNGGEHILEYSKHLCDNKIIIVTLTVSTPTLKCATDIVKVLVCAKQLSQACTYSSTTIELLLNSLHTQRSAGPWSGVNYCRQEKSKTANRTVLSIRSPSEPTLDVRFTTH